VLRHSVRRVEREALRAHVSAVEALSGTRRQEVRAQLDAKPNLLAWLFSSDTNAHGINAYMKLLEVRATHQLPALFTTETSDELVYWLCEHATHEQRRMLREIAMGLEGFRKQSHSTLATKVWRAANGVSTRIVDEVTNVVDRVGELGDNVQNALSLRTSQSTQAFFQVANNMRNSTFRLRVRRASDVDEMLNNLRYTVNCESAVLIPAPCDYRHEHYDLLCRRICVDDTNLSYGAAAKLRRDIQGKTDWMCQPTSPEGLCYSTGQLVNIPLCYLDPRFAHAGYKHWLSIICVPVVLGRQVLPTRDPTCSSESSRTRLRRKPIGKLSAAPEDVPLDMKHGERVVGVLKLINKNAYAGGSQGIPFRTSDIEAAMSVAVVIWTTCSTHFQHIKVSRMTADDAARQIQSAYRHRAPYLLLKRSRSLHRSSKKLLAAGSSRMHLTNGSGASGRLLRHVRRRSSTGSSGSHSSLCAALNLVPRETSKERVTPIVSTLAGCGAALPSPRVCDSTAPSLRASPPLNSVSSPAHHACAHSSASEAELSDSRSISPSGRRRRKRHHHGSGAQPSSSDEGIVISAIEAISSTPDGTDSGAVSHVSYSTEAVTDAMDAAVVAAEEPMLSQLQTKRISNAQSREPLATGSAQLARLPSAADFL
jgi:hypothetical protein